MAQERIGTTCFCVFYGIPQLNAMIREGDIFRAPKPLPILIPSKFVPKNGFPVVKALRGLLLYEKIYALLLLGVRESRGGTATGELAAEA